MKLSITPIMPNSIITPKDNNWLKKILENIAKITKIMDQYNVTDKYLSDPAKQVQVKYMSSFVKWIDIPYILANSDITLTLDPIIVELYYWEESNPIKYNIRRIEQLLYDLKK